MSTNMKNAEFESVRGVSAVVVSLRAAHLLCLAKRDFIWWLQSLSLKDGGFRRVARELLEMFPERLISSDFRHQALCPRRDRALCISEKPLRELSIEEFLGELCTNPKVRFSLPGMDAAGDELEAELLAENLADGRGNLPRAELVYFRDIIGALVEHRARHEKKIRANFHLTAIGQRIWEALDYALASRNMILVDGLEGRGKTGAVAAWGELHGGQARFVSVKGITNRTVAFREIAAALGITYAYGRTGPEMQSRVEDVLARSKILLVIDEAHFLFNQTRNMTARPELLDWIDSAICNRGVGAALVTTPQFIACLARAKNQVDYNFNQFRRRVKRWVKLPDKNSEVDIAAVARKIFPNVADAAVKKIVGYALLSKRDLSAVGDVASEVRAMLGTDDLGKVSVEQVHRAITEFLIPSDQAFKVALDTAESSQRKTTRRATPPAPEQFPAADDSLAPAMPPDISETDDAPAHPRTRGGLAVPSRGSGVSLPDRRVFEPALTAA